MFDTLISFFQELTVWQAFLVAFFTCLLFWASLWSFEAAEQKRRAEEYLNLFESQQKALEELNIFYAYQIRGQKIVANKDFMVLLGCHEIDELEQNILEKASKHHSFNTWWDFWMHTDFQSESMAIPFEAIDGQTYCLHARSISGVLFMWLSLIKSPHDEYILSRKMIDNVPIALWHRDKKMKVNYCNLVYAGALETTKSDVIDNGLEIYPSQRSGSPFQLTQKALESGKRQIQRINAVISGSRRYLEIGVVPFANGESMGYAFDMTEVESLQRDLQKHIDSQKEIMEHLSTPIAVFAADTRLTFYNQAYLNMFQFDPKWLQTMPGLGDILEDLRSRRKLPEYANFPAHKKERIKLFQTLLNPIQELLHQPDGQILRLFVAPHPRGGMIYIFEDVTDKIVLERKYNTLSAVQKETLDNLYEGIIVFGSDLRLRLMNKSFADTLMINDISWFIGRSLQEVLEMETPLFSANKNEFMKQLLSMFEKRHVSENFAQLTNGKWLKYTYMPLPDGSHLISTLDVTDTIRFQDALKERNRLLEEVDEVKSRFIRHVSDEIKAPLSAIQNHAMKMCEGDIIIDAMKRDDCVQEILTSTEVMLNLMEDMADLADIEAGQLTLMPQDVKISKFLKGVVSLIATKAAEQGIELVVRNESKIDCFRGDERRLKQAFFNVLVNAIRYKPHKGKLTFKVDIVEKNNIPYLVFSVLDTGFRIKRVLSPKADQSKHHTDVRQMFSSELGLTLVKRIIELHEGWMSFETIGEGEAEKINLSCFIPYRPTQSLNEPLSNNMVA